MDFIFLHCFLIVSSSRVPQLFLLIKFVEWQAHQSNLSRASVAWSSDGQSIAFNDIPYFCQHILPLFSFPLTKPNSFVRYVDAACNNSINHRLDR
jgi:hypothetical protein